MPEAKNTENALLTKPTPEVPEWAKQVKLYREAAGKTQVQVREAIRGGINTLSLIERGVRKFTAAERKLFFAFLGQPEDPAIPVKTRKGRGPGKKKAGKSVSRTKTPKAVVAVSPGTAPIPVLITKPAQKQKPKATPKAATAAPIIAKAVEAPLVVKKPVKKAASPKPGPKKVQPKTATTPKPLPAPTPAPAVRVHSPVKEAVIRDITRILGNPGLSDQHAQRLHSLFTSLAVNALLAD